MSTLLQDKVAVIYGGGGSIGGAVARTFAAEGAAVVVVGRTEATLDAVVADITSEGGRAEAAVFDALDEQAVDRHMAEVVERFGHVDVSLNLISRGDRQGTPLIEMATADLLAAVVNGLQTNFLTARAAARQMVRQGSGVILHLNSASGEGSMPGMGSTGPADAATESFMRYLAAEVGPRGVRVCGMWTAGVAETLSPEKLAGVGGPHGPTPQSAEEMISGMSALGRTPRLADVTGAAAFLASDLASGITGTVVNVTAGLVLR